jgi:hypothetical protein
MDHTHGRRMDFNRSLFDNTKIIEISEKVSKSLITPIRDRLHRYETHWKIMEICVIIFWNLCNRESM